MNHISHVLENTNTGTVIQAADSWSTTQTAPETINNTQQVEQAMQVIREQLTLIESILRVEKRSQQHGIEVSRAQALEGVFNGQHMVGQDGNIYRIPENYASKSQLVEGDMLKLCIDQGGRCRYKQICPTDRKNVEGVLCRDNGSKQWYVRAVGRSYNVLSASVSFYRGHEGSTVSLVVPSNGESKWGAVSMIYA
jgi:hypothetical protein